MSGGTEYALRLVEVERELATVKARLASAEERARALAEALDDLWFRANVAYGQLRAGGDVSVIAEHLDEHLTRAATRARALAAKETTHHE